VSPILRVCHRHRTLFAAGECCRECETGRYERKRAHTDRKHRGFRLAILERDGWRCHWCGGYGDTLDYVVALVDGGAAHDELNAVAACRSCNSRRGAGRGARMDREAHGESGHPRRFL
jgi:5-methylcytosine-specific restriction endonuclease McrA